MKTGQLNGNAGTRSRRGGDLFVTLFLVIAFPVAALAFFLTAWFIEPGDRLADLVPRSALIYVHASEPAASEMVLSSSVGMPQDVHPREVAVFAVSDENGDMHWATLLGWSPPFSPTDVETANLGLRGAMRLDERTYLIADEAAAALVLQTAGGDRLAGDVGIARALRTVRGVFPLQIFADLPSMAEGLPSAVAGFELRDGAFSLTAMPVKDAAAYLPFIGYGRRQAAPGRFAPKAFPGDPAVVTSEILPSFDPFALLALTDADLGAAARTFGERLRAPMSTALYVEAAEKRVEYLVHFPTIGADALSAELRTYLSTRWPDRQPLPLPDGDTVIEYKIAPEKTLFSPIEGSPAPIPMYSAPFGDTGAFVFFSSDGDGGAFMASRESLIAEALGPSASRRTIPGCPGWRGPTMFIRKPPLIFADQPIILSSLNMFAAEEMTVVKFGDNSIYVCGQSSATVDN